VRAHTAAGKLQGIADDAPWYEAALLVGITNALNVVADAPLETLEPPRPEAAAQAVFAEIRAFYDRADVPVPFRRVAADPGYLADLWGATRRTFDDNRLTRRHKEALAFAVSVTSRSAFGTAFHLGGSASASAASWKCSASRRCSRATRRSPTRCSSSPTWTPSRPSIRRRRPVA
jgi:hypothetical protein